MLAAYQEATVVFAYAGFGSELDTAALLRRILGDGKTLLMSRVQKEIGRLQLHYVSDLDELAPGIWGIQEPDPQRCPKAEPDALDLVVMPGAVFDTRCGRIGYGAGYYDKLLGGLAKRPYLVAPAFDLQIVGEVPMEPHDLRLDRVITERREFVCQRK